MMDIGAKKSPKFPKGADEAQDGISRNSRKKRNASRKKNLGERLASSGILIGNMKTVTLSSIRP